MYRADSQTFRRGLPLLVATLLALLLFFVQTQGVLAQETGVLTVEKTVAAGVTSVQSGEQFRYRIAYKCDNAIEQGVGCGDAALVDLLPPGVEAISVEKSGHVIGEPVISPTSVEINLDLNDGGETGIIYILARFKPGLQPNDPIFAGNPMPVINQVTLDGDNAPPATSTAGITLLPGTFEMQARKSVVGEPVVGQPFSFQVELCSPDLIGGAPIYNPVFVDTLPEGAIFISASTGGGSETVTEVDGVVTWNGLPSPWPVGSCLTRTVTVRYDAMPTPPNQVNAFTVTGETGSGQPIGPLPANVPFTVIDPYARMDAGKSASSHSTFASGSEVIVGEEIRYDLSIANTGYLTVVNGSITDTFPSRLDFTSMSFAPIPGTSAITLSYMRGGFLYTLSPEVTAPVTLTAGDLNGSGAFEYFRWHTADPIPPGSSWSASIVATTLAGPVPAEFDNCLDFNGVALTTEGLPGEELSGEECVTTQVIAPRSIPRIIKERTSAEHVLPLAEASYRITVSNADQANLVAVGPHVVDPLPAELEYQAGSFQIEDFDPPSLDLSGVTLSATLSGTQTVLEATFPTDFELPAGAWVSFVYSATVVDGTPPGRINNTATLLTGAENNPLFCGGTDDGDLDGDGNTGEGVCNSGSDLNVLVQLSADSRKYVRGQYETDWNVFGRTPEGGTADYRLVLTNTSNVDLDKITLVDMLPHPGDTGVIDTRPRDSVWRPRLQSLITGTIPVKVFYSAATNPCRYDLVPAGPSGCTNPNWSEQPPLNGLGQPDLSLVGSVRINLCSDGTWDNPQNCYSLPRGESVALEWSMVAPSGAPADAACLDGTTGTPPPGASYDQCPIAWNSFGFTATGGGEQFLPAEPPRVGIGTYPGMDYVIGDRVWLDMLHTPGTPGVDGVANGIQDAGEPGLNGIRVVLLKETSPGSGDFQPVDSMLTTYNHLGEPGFYQFQIPESEIGSYKVAFELPPGAQPSPGLQGSDSATDSNGTTLSSSIAGYPGNFIVTEVVNVGDGMPEPRRDMTIDQGIWLPADFGDAPTAGTSYPVTGTAAGYHVQVPGVSMKLGTRLDDEADGQPNITATGDDDSGGTHLTDNPGDDEDGVDFPGWIERDGKPSGVLTKGRENTLGITANVAGWPTTSPIYVHVWIDLDGDGVWGSDEVVTRQLPAANWSGTSYNFALPQAFMSGSDIDLGDTYMRVRISDQPTLEPGGGVLHGEVEDYRVQIVDAPLKSIVATSEAHTPVSGAQYGNNTRTSIGEIVRYRLTAPIPRGSLTNYRLTDYLPNGLQYLGNVTFTVQAADAALVALSTVPPAVSPASPVGGTDMTFTFGNITNASSGSGAEYMLLEFNALVLNTAGNQEGTNHDNNFDILYDDYSSRSNTVRSTVLEPTLNQTKSVQTVAPVDAGDVVTYTLVMRADSGASKTTAFDVIISDTLDSRLTPLTAAIVGSGTGVTGTNAAIVGQQISATVDAMAPGAVVTVTYTALVNVAAATGDVIPNTAHLVWTSLPGPNGTPTNPTGSTTPGTPGAGTGERDGSGGPNDYVDSDNKVFPLAQPQIRKMQPANPWTIGEYITFTLAITLPEGTTSNVVVTDTLPLGLRYLSYTLDASGFGVPGLAPGGVVTNAGDGNDIVWNLGTVVNPADNDTVNNVFFIHVATVVENIIENQHGDVLQNGAALGYSAGTEGPKRVDGGTVTVELVEPTLQIHKTVVGSTTPLDAGDLVTYTLVISHELPSIVAYDAVVTDVLPSTLRDMVYVGAHYANGDPAPDAGPLDSHTLRWPASGSVTLPVTEVVTIVYTARINESAVANTAIVNAARVTWASLPPDYPERRTHGGDPNDYERSTTAEITPARALQIVKSLQGTSAPHTDGSAVTIGEVVTYTLQITLTEGRWENLVVTDALPAGLSYRAGSATVVNSGFTLPVPTVAPVTDGLSGEDVALTFSEPFTVTGDNNLANNVFTVQLKALVLDEAGNVGLPRSPTVLTNSASVATESDPPVPSNPVEVQVVEPRMAIVKEIEPAVAPQNGVVTVTIVVSNTGLSTAFESKVSDLLPSELTYAGGLAESVTGGVTPGVFVTSTTSVSGDWAAFPVGGTSTIRFLARISADAVVGTEIVNTATVTNATTLPGDDPNERTEPEASDPAPVRVATHNLTLTKTSADDSYRAGETLVYTITVRNIGETLAPGVTITETVPPSTTFDAASSSATWYRVDNPAQPCATGDPAGTQCVIAVGDIAAGAGGYVNFAVIPPSPVPQVAPRIVNTATTGDDGTLGKDPEPGDNTQTITNTFQLAQLGDRVWVDANGNGIQETGEANVEGQVVNLYRIENEQPVFVGTTTTNAEGNYYFTNLEPGNYVVEFVPVPGRPFTLQNTPDDDGQDSDADPATGRTHIIPLEPGDIDHTIDAGVFFPASLGDYVWLDKNANGIQEDGEPGIEGVVVKLMVDGAVVMTTTTNANGGYLFTDLDPRNYVVLFERPAGLQPSPQHSAATTPDKDSNADPVTGMSEEIALGSQEHNPTIDAGFYALAGLGNYVWHDRNGDGIQDEGEAPIEGVVVSLLRPDGTVLLTTTTTITGHYEFVGLVPGDYVVQFAAPPGMRPTQPGIGDDRGVDSNADPISGKSAVITLESGEYNPTIDAGFYTPASLGDYVWHDSNLNGIQDEGEEPVPGVVVTLQRPDGTVLLTTTTTITGSYHFADLAPGDYVVHFAPPPGTQLTRQGTDPGNAGDSNANPATGLTAVVNLESGEHDPTIDAGIFKLGRLGDYVWRDSNANGIQDAGEAPIPGVTVRLLTPDGSIVATTVTDEMGHYIFENLVPGDYVLEFVPVEGLVGSPVGSGGDPGADSNADPVTGRTAPVTLPSGGEDLTIDAGFYQPASLGSYVWFDTNRDGIRDEGERPIAGVEVRLYQPGNPVPVAILITDSDGSFLFKGLPPGQYEIVFIPPRGLRFTEFDKTDSVMHNSDTDPVTGRTNVIDLFDGQIDLTWGAGFVEIEPTEDDPAAEPAPTGNSYWLPVISGN